MNANPRAELLERYGRIYGSLGLAIAFTKVIDPAKGDPKAVLGSWNKTKPLQSAVQGERTMGTGLTGNPVVVLRPSGLIGIENDTPEGLERIKALALPETVVVRSSEPWKQHRWYRPPNGRAPEYVAFRFEDGGVTADKGRYFLCPPAVHPTGVIYEFLTSPEDTQIAALPQDRYDELVRLYRETETSETEKLQIDPDAKILPGRRRKAIFRFASLQRRWTSSEEEIVRLALIWNESHCEPPLHEEQVRYQVKGVMAPKIKGGQELARVAALPADPPEPERPTEWGWPKPLSEAAYHGAVGDFVRALDPETEADPAAVLVSTLVMVGNCLGRASYAIAEADLHAPRLNALIVGETSRGRKGSSAGQVRRLLRVVDPFWEADCIDSGLVSGEGLVWAVRDAITKSVQVKEKGKPTGIYVDEITDEGVSDKRRLWLEGEFASVIKSGDREKNTLSAKARDCWDGIDLRTAAKNVGARATKPHVSILAHITRDELRRHLTATESLNGFINRFLFVCARRSKELPDGGNLSDAALHPIAEEIGHARQFAMVAGLIGRDDEARDLWHAVYRDLSSGKPGLLGAATARAEAQVLRLSVLYALLDLSNAIRVEHLQAALEVWRYCERSAAWVFGDATGDPVADELLMALRQTGDEGLTRTEIRDLFGRNQQRERIEAALRILAGNRLASMSLDGKTERWIAL